MGDRNGLQAKIISFPQSKKCTEKPRKSGLNQNRGGSVRKINGKVYVDFMYLGERVREPSGLDWNEKNAKLVRGQIDKIIVAIKSGTFRFCQVFPSSKKKDHFQEKENLLLGINKTPAQVLCKNYVWTWYELLKSSGQVSERTLLGYKSLISLYLEPFFGDMVFAELNPVTFKKFISWARKQCLRKKVVSNETINKILTLFKTICQDASVESGWGVSYNPFFGFKKLKEGDPLEGIFPFSIKEQEKLQAKIPDHWKPYFLFAFCAGLRQGEQIGLKLDDIDWSKKLLRVRRAITLNENGKRIEGRAKNKYSRRTIRLLPAMYEVLKAQKKIYDQFKCEYFFCTPTRKMIHPSNLRRDVWIPALNEAGLKLREMRQTRHSFATVALSCGESPLWIAKVMGHRDTNMIIRVYGKYIADACGSNDGAAFDSVYQGIKGKEK